MEYKKYSMDLPYGYVFGAFGTIELLKHQCDKCLAVIVDPSFITNEAYNLIHDICMKNHIKIEINLKLINQLRDKGNIFVIGVFKKYESQISKNKHVVLKSISDDGVIGTIIRSMNGFEYYDLILIDCNVDLYSNHLIRSTMGAFFNVNIKRYKNLIDYKNDYPNNDIYVINNQKGEQIKKINNNDYSLLFTLDNIELNDAKYICLNQDIPLENKVNIILFSLYNK